MGVSAVFISEVLSSKKRLPSRMFRDICEYLKVAPEELQQLKVRSAYEELAYFPANKVNNIETKPNNPIIELLVDTALILTEDQQKQLLSFALKLQYDTKSG